jgi:hypothetical protein
VFYDLFPKAEADELVTSSLCGATLELLSTLALAYANAMPTRLTLLSSASTPRVTPYVSASKPATPL